MADNDVNPYNQPRGRRWAFTVFVSQDTHPFWRDANVHCHLEYLICQLERCPRTGSIHWQGFLILRKRQRLSWMKKWLHPTANFSLAYKSNEANVAYCSKLDTRVYPEQLPFVYGEIPEEITVLSNKELNKLAIEQLDMVRKGEMLPSEVDTQVLLKPGFVTALRHVVSTMTGPYRPELKVITIIGTTGCGKSYAINKIFPNVCKGVYGNSGLWWVNPEARVAVVEEFAGQIPLQKMLGILDPYPNSLDVKGSMSPCNWELCFLTSNIDPSDWYPNEYNSAKRSGSVQAFYRRIGYSPKTENCIIIPSGYSKDNQRKYLWQKLRTCLGMPAEPADAIIPAMFSAAPVSEPSTRTHLQLDCPSEPVLHAPSFSINDGPNSIRAIRLNPSFLSSFEPPPAPSADFECEELPDDDTDVECDVSTMMNIARLRQNANN